jgi:hypothetical protein
VRGGGWGVRVVGWDAMLPGGCCALAYIEPVSRAGALPLVLSLHSETVVRRGAWRHGGVQTRRWLYARWVCAALTCSPTQDSGGQRRLALVYE